MPGTQSTPVSPSSWRWLLLCLLLPSVAAVDAANALVLGVHPYLGHSEVQRRFQPLAEYLGERLGIKVELKVGDSYERHIDALGNGEIDLAFIGPASYVELVGKYGPHPLLARLEVEGSPTFTGHIIVRQDSALRGLPDLTGKRFAFGSPRSTMSHLVPVYMLHQAGVDIRDLAGYRFYGSHNNVAMAVLAGDADAGAVKQEVAEAYAARGLRILATTPELSEHPFVARRDLPAELLRQIRDALLALDARRPPGDGILHSIKADTTALVPAVDGDYENLRQILATVAELGVNP